MNRQILQHSASEWVRQAKNDIRNKITEFMNEVNTSRTELAYALAISEGELAQILEGNGEITLSTFAKLLIATGNVLEIKPIEESPLAIENGAPVMPENGMRMPPMPHGRPMRRPGSMPPPPPGLFDEVGRPGAPAPAMRQPRDASGRFRPWPRNPQPAPQPAPSPASEQQPNFAAMEREKLVDIIQNKLWDSEIDVESASHEQLVRFLEDKDRRRNELRASRQGGIPIDPSVVQLKDKIKDTLAKNPHLRNYLKDIFQ